MDTTILHVQNKIAEYTSEVLHSNLPGFTPVDSDVRSSVRSLPTVAPLSVAAPGDAQFVLVDAAGRRTFSRDGGFVLEAGVLKASDGRRVQGFVGGSAAPTSLELDAHDQALGRVRALHIESDGALCYTRSVIDPQSQQRRQERVCVGVLALARFPVGTQLIPSPSGDRAPLGIEPHLGRAGDGNFALLQPGRRDAGQVDMHRAVDRLHDLYAQLEAMTAATQAKMGLEKSTLDLVK